MAAMKRVAVANKAEHLAYSLLVPDDFRQVPLPEEATDFADPTSMMPLGVFMAGYGAVLCTIAARPVRQGASVMDMAMQLCAKQTASGGVMKKLMPETKWGTTVVAMEAAQPTEAGEMTVRTYFFEDGGTLFNVGMMAPAALWASVEATLTAMVDSFSLVNVSGPTAPIAPGQKIPAKAVFAPHAQAAAEVAPPTTQTAAPAPPGSALPDMTAYALADARAMDPEESINVRFRDAGAGLVVNVLSRDEAKRCLLIGAGALEALLPVPMGWHVVDDGRRTLIFDAQNKVQVNLNLMRVEGRSPSDIFTEIIADLSRESPNVEHRTVEIEGYNTMQVRNVIIDGTHLQQVYLLRRHPSKEGLALKVRVTVSDEQVAQAMDMTGAILNGLRFG